MLDRGERVVLRVLFPVEVVEEPRQAPQILVLAAHAGVVPNGGLHGVHVLAETLVLDPLLEEGDGVVAVGHGQSGFGGSGRTGEA